MIVFHSRQGILPRKHEESRTICDVSWQYSEMRKIIAEYNKAYNSPKCLAEPADPTAPARNADAAVLPPLRNAAPTASAVTASAAVKPVRTADAATASVAAQPNAKG
ncbi:hypothetical protein AVEN_129855-1 [Araneus ventricosus]|uniref:Uncharacterized protein n=1 Tax=Araneus ventricosus TaxID=182803 RepID=A0A4Y2JG47_ARAVE|nr:hypothetical protein AVEN_129855-1 [Araneus ventricosus]